MAKDLLDIRFYKRGELEKNLSFNTDGRTDIGINFVPERFACKLREKKFTTSTWSHLYIYFTDELNPGVIELKSDGVQVLTVEYGATRKEVYLNNLDERDRFSLMVIGAVLKHVSKEFELNISEVENTSHALEKYGRDLHIICNEKETRKERIVVSFTVDAPSFLYVSVFDKNQEQWRRHKVVELRDPRDAYILSSRIATSKNEIRIFPRKSERARHTTDYYYERLFSDNYFVSLLPEQFEKMDEKKLAW